jgi:hypothetical protein
MSFELSQRRSIVLGFDNFAPVIFEKACSKHSRKLLVVDHHSHRVRSFLVTSNALTSLLFLDRWRLLIRPGVSADCWSGERDESRAHRSISFVSRDSF